MKKSDSISLALATIAILGQTPGLKARLTDEALRKAYRRALAAAWAWRGLESQRFPSENPYDLEMLIDSNYCPEKSAAKACIDEVAERQAECIACTFGV